MFCFDCIINEYDLIDRKLLNQINNFLNGDIYILGKYYQS